MYYISKSSFYYSYGIYCRVYFVFGLIQFYTQTQNVTHHAGREGNCTTLAMLQQQAGETLAGIVRDGCTCNQNKPALGLSHFKADDTLGGPMTVSQCEVVQQV